MRLLKFNILVVALMLLGIQSCVQDGVVDLREKDYGYVQFKLYKSASYTPSKGSRATIVDELDYLADACKIEVNLYDENGVTIRQSLVLSSANSEAAEFGLRSGKLKLLSGSYRLGMITLFDVLDNVLYQKVPTSALDFEVTVGGLTQHDVAVDVTPRGAVRFTLVKDLSSFKPVSRGSVEREYTFDEIKFVDIAVKRVINEETNETIGREIIFENIPAKFRLHFDEENYQNNQDGWQTSSILCDTLLSLEADTYRVVSYTTKNKRSGGLLETNNSPALSTFKVEDNRTTEAKVKIALYESDAYIKDNYALYEIWKSLNGEKWCYNGESYPTGANWNFDKDVDLWCDQPGVEVHSNGRIARIDLSGFGFYGDMSPAIGDLTELVELYLGTHNDTNRLYDPSLDMNRSYLERQRSRFDDQRNYLQTLHTPIQMSEPCARAFKEKYKNEPNKEILEMALYKTYTESEIIDKKSGKQTIRKYDMNHGVKKNGLTSLPAEIGNLKKLEILYIANGEIKELPAEVAQLESLTDIEIYNCSEMDKFPVHIGQLPALRSVNIANNKQWSTEEMEAGMEALAKGASRKTIEILYARENRLSKLDKAWFGASRGGFEAMGLLDLAFNEIKQVDALGKEVAFVQLYLDNNQIEYIPHDSEGYFCGYDDVENFSVNFNKLKKLPNIFSSKAVYTMASVSFAGNDIDGCELDANGKYNGIKVNTLTLSMNPLKKYPKEFADSNSLFEYLIVSACQISEIPHGSFSHKNAVNHMSFDFSYNQLTKLPDDFHAGNMPYLYGLDLSFNRFEKFPYLPLDAAGLTVLALRSQRDAEGNRCLQEWPQGIYQHVGLRGLYLGSNDLGKVDDTISTLCYYLDISDNPNIVFDASDICYAWQVGAYILYYDKTQKILNCDAMLE